ncbi:MAG: ABC transporter ATP-binding protein [Actinomycetota bacterium]
MYTLRNVTKRYAGARAVIALDDVSLEIPDGQMVAVQGPTGGGKSTLLQMLGGMDRPSAGSVELAGRDLAALSGNELARVRAHEVGIVFQTFNLLATLSAVENVETALVPSGVPHEERRARARGALGSVGLAERADHLPGELSGGEQQRVALARALVKKPRVLLADEPTGNLDVGTRDEIMDLIEERWRAEGLTIVLVTHDPRVAQRAERRLQIVEGQVRECA